MRAYSLGEDNLILEAALIAGIHRNHGRVGGINQLAKQFGKTHQTLCRSRGLAAGRTVHSLKMRLYRLFNAGAMKWGTEQDKSRVAHPSPLLNMGTSEQRASRDYLIKLMFVQPGGSRSYIPTFEKKKKKLVVSRQKNQDVSHQARLAVEAARNARRARRVAARENESSSTGPCYAIANPSESCNLLPVGIQSDKKEEDEVQGAYDTEIVPDRMVEERKAEVSTFQAAYKENLKTFRDLSAMRHDALEIMRRECESHRDFLQKSLADLGEQQKYLLQMMGKEAASKENERHLLPRQFP